MKSLHQLIHTLPQQGRVEWIGVRPAKRVAVESRATVNADPDTGLVGDRYSGRSGDRHITLIQAEHLPVIASCLGLPEVPPELLRRNIVVSGFNLLALKDKHVQLGTAEILVTGQCHPCSRMEEVLGPGGYNAVRGHGGITARVLVRGTIAVGDTVTTLHNK
ncbi:MAG: MOSC domain-containing protein [Pseudomonadales bacterium]